MTVFTKGLVGGWTDGRGCRLSGPCRAATVVHVGIRAGLGGGGWVVNAQGTGWTQSYGEAKAAAHSQGLRFLPALPRLREMPHPAARP